MFCGAHIAIFIWNEFFRIMIFEGLEWRSLLSGPLNEATQVPMYATSTLDNRPPL